MNGQVILDLARRLQVLERQGVRHRQGIITATSPLAVALGGSDVPYTAVRALAGVQLRVDDVVSVATFGNDLLVLGVASTGSVQAWQTPTLLNGWQNWSTATGDNGFNNAGFYRDPLGIVRLRGLLVGATINTIAFVLPPGSRPARRELLAASTVSAGTYIAARLDVTTGGQVIPVIGGAGPGTYFSLDGLTLRAS